METAMRHWTHDELHTLIGSNNILKIQSDEVHALPKRNSEDRENSKLRMMAIYAETIHCKQIDIAREFVKKVFANLRQGMTRDVLIKEYSAQRLCHSPVGNDYLCFCDEKTA